MKRHGVCWSVLECVGVCQNMMKCDGVCWSVLECVECDGVFYSVMECVVVC